MSDVSDLDEKTKPHTIRFPVPMYAELRRLGKEQGRTFNAQVLHLIGQGMLAENDELEKRLHTLFGRVERMLDIIENDNLQECKEKDL